MCFCVNTSSLLRVLAEVASLLSRSVSYEGPALRKQVAKAQQQQQDLTRREVECQSSSADLRERYYAACKQYGITVSPASISSFRAHAVKCRGSLFRSHCFHNSLFLVGYNSILLSIFVVFCADFEWY